MNFKITLERDEDGWLVATYPSLPGCISQGKTEREAVKNMKEAIHLHLRSLAEDGIPINPDKHKIIFKNNRIEYKREIMYFTIEMKQSRDILWK